MDLLTSFFSGTSNKKETKLGPSPASRIGQQQQQPQPVASAPSVLSSAVTSGPSAAISNSQHFLSQQRSQHYQQAQPQQQQQQQHHLHPMNTWNEFQTTLEQSQRVLLDKAQQSRKAEKKAIAMELQQHEQDIQQERNQLEAKSKHIAQVFEQKLKAIDTKYDDVCRKLSHGDIVALTSRHPAPIHQSNEMDHTPQYSDDSIHSYRHQHHQQQKYQEQQTQQEPQEQEDVVENVVYRERQERQERQERPSIARLDSVFETWCMQTLQLDSDVLRQMNVAQLCDALHDAQAYPSDNVWRSLNKQWVQLHKIPLQRLLAQRLEFVKHQEMEEREIQKAKEPFRKEDNASRRVEENDRTRRKAIQPTDNDDNEISDYEQKHYEQKYYEQQKNERKSSIGELISQQLATEPYEKPNHSTKHENSAHSERKEKEKATDRDRHNETEKPMGKPERREKYEKHRRHHASHKEHKH